MSVWSGEKKLCFSGLCQSSVTAPYCKDGEPRYPPKHIRASQISMNITQIPIDTPQTSPRHLKTSPGKSRCQQTTTDANRHPQTPSDTDKCCFSMSGGVCWRVLLSVDIVSSLEMSEGCLGDIWGYMSDIHRH